MSGFGSVAHEWSVWRKIDKMYDPLQSAVLELISQRRVKTHPQSLFPVFEMGIGTGYLTKLLLDLDPWMYVCGIDNSIEMIEGALRYLEPSRSIYGGRVVLRCADAAGEPFPDENQYKAVVSALMLHNLAPGSERLRVCRRAYSALSPGGWFINGDKITHDNPAEYHPLFTERMVVLEQLKDLGYPESYAFYREHDIDDHTARFTETEQIELLQEAGFVNVEILQRFGLYAVAVGQRPAED